MKNVINIVIVSFLSLLTIGLTFYFLISIFFCDMPSSCTTYTYPLAIYIAGLFTIWVPYSFYKRSQNKKEGITPKKLFYWRNIGFIFLFTGVIIALAVIWTLISG